MTSSAENSLVMSTGVQVPLSELTFTFARSSGPGGQNVNKVNSKAHLRWPVATSPSLPEPLRHRFMAKYRTRITTEGDLVLSSQRFRDAKRNADDCLEKLTAMLEEVARPPVRRRATRPSRASVQKRLETKQAKSNKKTQRRRPIVEE